MGEPARTCVIHNPASGRGRARRGIEAMRRAGSPFEFRATRRAGEAESMAQEAIAEGFGRIIAAGGDGTVHEVANGILRAGRPDIVFAVRPFGSANDYAFALGITGDPGQPTQVQSVDVGRIRGADGRERFFVNGLGVGFNGAVTAEARRIRWLRGMPLYALAICTAMLRHFDRPLMTVRLDDIVRRVPTLALTLNLGQREGGFPITSRADLADGLFDSMHAGPVSRLELLRYFPNLMAGTLPENHPRMWQNRCRRLDIESEAPLHIHLDGEFFCRPADGIAAASVELLPARLRVERAAGAPASR